MKFLFTLKCKKVWKQQILVYLSLVGLSTKGEDTVSGAFSIFSNIAGYQEKLKYCLCLYWVGILNCLTDGLWPYMSIWVSLIKKK